MKIKEFIITIQQWEDGYEQIMVGGGGDIISKDLKSSHQTGKTLHKSYNNDIQFTLCFSYSLML